MKFNGSGEGWYYWPHCLTKRCAQNELQEALAAVDDFSDGSKHDWRRFAHVLARAYRTMEVKAETLTFNISDLNSMNADYKQREADSFARAEVAEQNLREANRWGQENVCREVNLRELLEQKFRQAEESRDHWKEAHQAAIRVGERFAKERDEALARVKELEDKFEKAMKELESKNGIWIIENGYSSDRVFLCKEIGEGLKQRGFWTPKDFSSSDIIVSIFRAIEDVESRLSRALAVIEGAEKALKMARALECSDNCYGQDHRSDCAQYLFFSARKSAISAIRDFREGKS